MSPLVLLVLQTTEAKLTLKARAPDHREVGQPKY